MPGLFEPFRRPRAHRGRGSGLGLSIVRAVAEAHGGTVAAHPRPRGGLTVEVAFRLRSGPTQERHPGDRRADRRHRRDCGRMIQVDHPTTAQARKSAQRRRRQARKSAQRRRRQRVMPSPGAPPAAGTPCGRAGCGRSAAGSGPRRGPARSGRTRDSSTPSPRVSAGSCCCSSCTRAAGIVALEHARRRRASSASAGRAPQPRQRRQHRRRACRPGPRAGSGGSARSTVGAGPPQRASSAPAASGCGSRRPVLDMLLSKVPCAWLCRGQ